jgi:hypothetical protein
MGLPKGVWYVSQNSMFTLMKRVSRQSPGMADGGTSSERVRRWRKRRHQGMRPVHIELHVSEIEALVRTKFLKDGEREDPQALQTGVLNIVYRALEKA